MAADSLRHPRVNFVHPLLRARDWQDRPELGELCAWWQGGGAGLCALVGIGGAGKTAIADRFLQVLPGVLPDHPQIAKRSDLRTPERLLVFSFYHAPNPDTFFAELSTWLKPPPPLGEGGGEGLLNQSDPARASYQQTLALLSSAGRCLLVLDGLEKVQDDGVRGGVFGELQDGRLSDLLVRVAEGYLPSLSVLITSRFPLAELDERGSGYYRPIAVEEIEPAAAVALLRQRNVRGTDDQLRTIAAECGHHALTVDLAGGFIAEFGRGDPTTPLRLTRFDDEEQARRAEPTNDRRRRVRLQEYRFARIAERYRASFKASDPAALALLERICLFRLGVTADTLASIFTGKAKEKKRIAGPALAGLTPKQLQQTLDRLVAMRLLEQLQITNQKSKIYAIHPAVRDGFLAGLDADTRRQGHEAARTGLNATLGEQPGKNPSDPTTLDLLEEIVHHTIQSGHVPEAWDIYWDRIGGFRNLGWRLGAYERGERICRAFAGGESPETVGWVEERDPPSTSSRTLVDGGSRGLDPPYKSLPEHRQAIFINAWAMYLKELGRLATAARCYELGTEMAMRQEKLPNASIGNQNLTDVWLLSGRLTSALASAAEALRLAELADDAEERFKSHACRAHARALRGEVPAALADFRAAHNWQHKAETNATDRPLWGLGGFHLTGLLARLGRREEATRLTEANKQVQWKLLGDSAFQVPPCNLILSDLHRESGDLPHAESLWASARDWAVARDAKEVLCWSALVQAKNELSAFNDQQSAKEERQRFLERAKTPLEDGLKIARDCGYGIYHIELLLERARLHLLFGNPQAALDDLHVALDGVPANAHTGQPELLAATHADCGYTWTIAAGLHLRGEALLLQAAQSLGRDSFVVAKRPQLPADVQALIHQAESCLTEALQRWQPLRDPEPNNANFVHPQTGTEYNYRAAETYRVLDDLAGGILTRSLLEAVALPTNDSNGQKSLEAKMKETTPMATTFKYDALISYRRQEPDKTFARELLKRLEAKGLKVAIDERDFDPAATFLEEMERCIKESRFTLAVASPRYFESGNCVEEAIICKVLDMAERRRRMIPLIIESVTMPFWLYNIVGINFTDADPLVDPHEKLIKKLRNP